MKSFLCAVLSLLLSGCAGVISTQRNIAGRYQQDGLLWGSMAVLILKPDGTYILGDEVVKCVPQSSEAADSGLSYAIGTWTIRGGLVMLMQSEAHCGNFMSTGDYGNLRFHIAGVGLRVKLRAVAKNSWSFVRTDRIEKTKAPNQALQHNDPSCHVPCLRTYRASRGRG